MSVEHIIKYIVFDYHNQPLSCIKEYPVFGSSMGCFLNLASFIIGACLRRLFDDWQNRSEAYTAAVVRIDIKIPIKDLYIYPRAKKFRQNLCAR